MVDRGLDQKSYKFDAVKVAMHHTSDPSNGFHELRRYLLSHGLDTRPLINQEYKHLVNKGIGGVDTETINSIDNALYFMLRKVYQTDSMVPVLANVFIFRVFFPHDQDNKGFVVQICLCHYGHGLFEMNQAYAKVMQCLNDQGWGTVDLMHNTLTFEMCFRNVQRFKILFQPLYSIFREHDLLNNHLISVENSM